MANYIEEVVVNGNTYYLPGAGKITEIEQGIVPVETVEISDDGNDIVETFADGATMHSVIDDDTITMTHTSAAGAVTVRTVTITDTLITIE